MVNLSIPYGQVKLEFQIPERNLVEVLQPNPITLPDSEEEEIARAIENPIGTKELQEIVRPDHTVAIICEDITRPTPSDRILPLLLDRLQAAGVSDKKITIFMALGSHRPMTEEEIVKKVGLEIMDRVRVTNSEFRDKSKLVDLGQTSGGVRVWIDKRVVESDIKIGIGNIVPHGNAGYTGGGKIIYPGVAGEETVAQFHLRCALVKRNVLGEEENPARREMEDWVEAVDVGLDFIINCILTPQDRIYRVVAGHYVKAHRAGVTFSREVYGVRARERVDIAVASSHPADFDFWQGWKGIISGELLVKDGGTLILASPCYEGVGPHPSFLNYCGTDNIDRFLKDAQEGKINVKEMLPLTLSTGMVRIRKRINLAIISDGLTEEEIKRGKFEPFSDINDAIQHALAEHGNDAQISVLPYGGHTYPYLHS